MKTLTICLLISISGFAQESFVELSEFHKSIEESAPYILKTPYSERENLLLQKSSKDKGENIHYLVKEDKWFETDIDVIKEMTGEEKYLAAHEKFFDRFEFDASGGIFNYNYPLLSYWDILPHPPIASIDRPMEEYTADYGAHAPRNETLISYDFNKELNETTKTDLSYDNKLEFLANGEFYVELLKHARKAKKFILGSGMFLTCDPSIMPLVDLLEEKVKSGVPVFLILDRIFALKYGKCFKMVRKTGVKVIYSDKMVKVKNSVVYHNKFWVFDNKKALVFGANLLDAQVESTGLNEMYRDSGVMIEGPAVRDITKEYISLANYLKKWTKDDLSVIAKENDEIIKKELSEKKRGLENYEQHKEKDGMCRVVFQGPHNSQTNVTDLYMRLFEETKHSMFISMVRLPMGWDFENDRMVATALKKMAALAENGVRVDLLTNNWLTPTNIKSVNYKDTGIMTSLYRLFVKMEDRNEVIRESRTFYKDRDGANDNFKIWHYFRYNHAKTLMIDNTLNVIGSYNLNTNSTDRSFEMTVVCHDKKLHNDFSKSIVLDLMNSVPLLRGKN